MQTPPSPHAAVGTGGGAHGVAWQLHVPVGSGFAAAAVLFSACAICGQQRFPVIRIAQSSSTVHSVLASATKGISHALPPPLELPDAVEPELVVPDDEAPDEDVVPDDPDVLEVEEEEVDSVPQANATSPAHAAIVQRTATRVIAWSYRQRTRREMATMSVFAFARLTPSGSTRVLAWYDTEV